MKSFGKNSTNQISTCHVYIQKILHRALEMSIVDFGVSEGHRSVDRQNMLFLMGRSKIDGVDRKGKHNKIPSEAADIYAYTPNKEYRRKISYDKSHLSYIAGVITAACHQLNKDGDINCTIRWGANWNRNGIIDLDQSFDDYPHFEIENIDL
jgi:peptidoglycan L-alanyl-D-glutamate endopeptidase CwlK